MSLNVPPREASDIRAGEITRDQRAHVVELFFDV